MKDVLELSCKNLMLKHGWSPMANAGNVNKQNNGFQKECLFCYCPILRGLENKEHLEGIIIVEGILKKIYCT